MSKFCKNKVLPRYLIIAGALTLLGIGVVAKAAYTMTSRKNYWDVVAESQKSDSVRVRPKDRKSVV